MSPTATIFPLSMATPPLAMLGPAIVRIVPFLITMSTVFACAAKAMNKRRSTSFLIRLGVGVYPIQCAPNDRRRTGRLPRNGLGHSHRSQRLARETRPRQDAHGG